MKTYAEYREEFAENGFIHIPQFLTEAEVRDVEDRIDAYLRDIAPTRPRTEIMYDDYERPETLKRISNLSLDPFFAGLATSPKWIDLASTLLAEAVKEPKNMQYFNKPPEGSETPPHQDGYYFCLVPNEALTLWLPLDDVDVENGAMRYVTGSHKRGVLPHNATQMIGFSQQLDTDNPDAGGEEVTCVVKRGDLLVHHSLTIHAAYANTSDRQRRVLGQVYFSQKAEVDPEMKRKYDAALEAQRKAAGII
ncbi:MAG: phytanoyl-CoA dioxygenase family protein [Anaerolineae bacterium]|nr:phytanoyl-CoA dioxygenase family protein [Anaerolineae bacterium]